MALTDNLIAFWELNETSGTRADEVSGLTLNDLNGVTYAAGKISNAAQFAGASEQALYRNDTAFDVGDGSFTFVVWIYADSLGGAFIFGKDDANTHRDYYFYISSTGIQFTVFKPTDTGVALNYSGSFSTSTWYYIVASHNAATDTSSVAVDNGTAQTQAIGGSLQTASTATFYIGTRTSLTNYYSGRIDQVGFWKRILTASEQTWLYNSGSGRAYADLSSYTEPTGHILKYRVA